jgi:hypothetical protein
MGKYRLFKLKSYQRSIGQDYDWILEQACFKFELKNKTRKQDKVDRLHYFLIFWKDNKDKTVKYKTYESIAEFLGLNHSTVIHYVGKPRESRLNRKKSNSWDINVVLIKDFIGNATLNKTTLR